MRRQSYGQDWTTEAVFGEEEGSQSEGVFGAGEGSDRDVNGTNIGE